MRGGAEIRISTKKISYTLTIRRNITLIQGDSGTGKTVICKLIDEWLKKSSFVNIAVLPTLERKMGIATLDDRHWQYDITACTNTIFFIDEDNAFVYTKEFANKIHGSSNYFVIFTRHTDVLGTIPLSVHEVYTLKTSGKYNFNKEIVPFTYNESIWNPHNVNLNCSIDTLLLEDSESGYRFFTAMCRKTNCVTTHGNGNALKALKKCGQEFTLVMLDGAAYGALLYNLQSALQTIKTQNILFYFPESFEWLLLHSPIFNSLELVRLALCNYHAPVDSKDFLSWEKYYESILKQACMSLGFSYSKRKINALFLNETTFTKIKKVIGLNII